MAGYIRYGVSFLVLVRLVRGFVRKGGPALFPCWWGGSTGKVHTICPGIYMYIQSNKRNSFSVCHPPLQILIYHLCEKFWGRPASRREKKIGGSRFKQSGYQIYLMLASVFAMTHCLPKCGYILKYSYISRPPAAAIPTQSTERSAEMGKCD